MKWEEPEPSWMGYKFLALRRGLGNGAESLGRRLLRVYDTRWSWTDGGIPWAKSVD